MSVIAKDVLPGPLRHRPGLPFAGRRSELTTLEQLLPVGPDNAGRVALLRGEAGSGKTRLVREFATAAAGRGVLVLYGACDAVVNAAYQPFVQALNGLAHTGDRPVGDDPAGSELRRILPKLGRSPLPATDPDTERYRLHAAVVDVLTTVTRDRPVLIVLDDVHWADTASLHLLRHLAATTCGAIPLLVVVTVRDHEPGRRTAFTATLADLLRGGDVVRIHLAGLTDTEVADFIRQAMDLDADASEVASEINGLTDGNPFLVCELYRSLVESDGISVSGRRVRLARRPSSVSSPETVRQVIGDRLDRLTPRTVQMLETAAIAGPEFGLPLLAAATGHTGVDLIASLEEAIHAGMVVEASDRSAAYRFGHELVRRALYDRIAGPRRAALHLRVAEVLEATQTSPTTRGLRELAHHFALAAPLAGTGPAVEYSIRAARAAMAGSAFDDAADLFSTALEFGIDDQQLTAQIQIDLGTALHRAGQAHNALEAFEAAADYAREHGDSSLLADAAVRFGEACWRPAIAYDRAAALLDAAASALGGTDSPIKARVLAWSSRALSYLGEFERAANRREEAVAMARRLGDDRALADALLQAYTGRGSLPLRQVLTMLAEARRVGERLDDPELVAAALAWAIVPLFELCDLHGARREVGALRQAAERTGQPFHMYTADLHAAALALCDGRLDDAEALAHRSWAWTRQLSAPQSSGQYGLQMFSIRREQGRLAELRPVLRIWAERSDGSSPWRPGLVVLLIELGMESEARAELGRLRAEGFDCLPHDGLRVAALTFIADACSALNDTATAARTYRLLQPMAGGNTRIGQAIACYGAVDRYLGVLAAVIGDLDSAAAHLDAALNLNMRMAAHTWTAHTAYEYARVLRARGRRADRPRAAELLATAENDAHRYGLSALQTRIQALGPAPRLVPNHPDGLTAREVEILRLVAAGRSNRDIGKDLYISEHTAANHIRSILRKTGTANRTDAATYAHRHGLTDT